MPVSEAALARMQQASVPLPSRRSCGSASAAGLCVHLLNFNHPAIFLDLPTFFSFPSVVSARICALWKALKAANFQRCNARTTIFRHKEGEDFDSSPQLSELSLSPPSSPISLLDVLNALLAVFFMAAALCLYAHSWSQCRTVRDACGASHNVHFDVELIVDSLSSHLSRRLKDNGEYFQLNF